MFNIIERLESSSIPASSTTKSGSIVPPIRSTPTVAAMKAPSAETQCDSKIMNAQTALLTHGNTMSHTPLTLPHKNGFINAVETINPTATTKTTLLLLHGWGAGLAMFYRTLSHLPFSTIISIDLPGMGGSSREKFPEEYEEGVDYFVEALDEAFQQLSERDSCNGTCILAGHSLGGFVAAEWQLRKTRFNGVILISPVGVPHRPKTNPSLGITWKLVRRLWGNGVTPQTFVRLLGRKPVRSFVRMRFNLPDEEALLVSEYLYEISAAPPAGERSINVLLAPGAWARVPLAGRLGGIDVPVGFLYGEMDWMDWTAGEVARGELKWSCLERVAGAGHHVFVDNPKEFALCMERVVGEMTKSS